MLRRILLAASRNRWLAERVPRYGFVQAAARRFIPGEDIDAALMAAADLARAGATTIVSRLGEDVADGDEATRVRDHYWLVLDRIAEDSLPTHISVKLSHLGLAAPSGPPERGRSPQREEVGSGGEFGASAQRRDAPFPASAEQDPSPQRGEVGRGVQPRATAGDAHTAGLLANLAAHAARTGGIVWVDMEGSALTDRTIQIFRTVLARHRNIGICLQAYLRRTEHDLEALATETTAIRLVKGAYNEPEAIAWRRKHDVDAAFHRLALRLLELHRDRDHRLSDSQSHDRDRNRSDSELDHDHDVAPSHARGTVPDPARDPAPLPALATHDFALLRRIMNDARERGVRTSHYEIQLLGGIRVADRQRLAAADDGPGVRVLVSYGTNWFPWFVRRLAERPANLALLARSIFQR